MNGKTPGKLSGRMRRAAAVLFSVLFEAGCRAAAGRWGGRSGLPARGAVGEGFIIASMPN
jgi:glutaminase